MPTLSIILIANRGEIACRVIKTVQAMGKTAIAIYSKADASAPHVALADQAICVGPAPADQSYLNSDAILAAAQSVGADAIHPGYGFLSENAAFAKACDAHGLVFIGPSANAIEVMGSKSESKKKMLAVGVPCVPGYNGENQDKDALIAQAQGIGFPLMVKASAGGGGRGMRLVHDEADLGSALDLAKSEARNAFGDDHLILEKAIEGPRHIEIQVFGDKHGHLVHLGERDCSLQRRHQKIIEEAPSPAVDETLRQKMGEAAISAARAVDYVGAGTVEFLLDAAGDFYFLEMNTRLQVEHPVSECITGLDFVALQITVAEGQPLPFSQADVTLNGHAIEARLYCEDPDNDFLPATGFIDLWRPPSNPQIRTDDGIRTGQTIEPFYDPMAAKVIAHAPTREEARLLLVGALEDTLLFGPKNNIAFLLDCLKKKTFADAGVTTGFIVQEFRPGPENGVRDDTSDTMGDTLTHAVIAAVIDHECQARRWGPSVYKNWSSAYPLKTRCLYEQDGDTLDLTVRPTEPSSYSVAFMGADYSVTCLRFDSETAVLVVGKTRLSVRFLEKAEGDFWLCVKGVSRRYINQIYQASKAASTAAKGAILAPMHGLLADVFVRVGDTVTAGQPLAVLEAMKMQHEISADMDGVVAALPFNKGEQVRADALLIEIAAD